MKYRKLRTARSVACGGLRLMLIALWVRSYYSIDTVFTAMSDTQVLQMGSGLGQLTIELTNFKANAPQIPK